MYMSDIDDKDLPDIKPEDIKVDISTVDKMDAKELATATAYRTIDTKDNSTLLFLKQTYERKLPLLKTQLETEKDTEIIKNTQDKIDRITEKYGLVIKQIQARKKGSK